MKREVCGADGILPSCGTTGHTGELCDSEHTSGWGSAMWRANLAAALWWRTSAERGGCGLWLRSRAGSGSASWVAFTNCFLSLPPVLTHHPLIPSSPHPFVTHQTQRMWRDRVGNLAGRGK